MASNSIPSFERLSSAAANLNKSSDELKKVINDLEVQMKALKIGLSAWIDIGKWDDPLKANTTYELWQLGYSKMAGVWGLRIRKLTGNYQTSEPDKIRESWEFNEAPRSMRLLALEKIDDLFSELTKRLDETSAKVNKGLSSAKLVASGVNTAKGGK